MRRRRKFVGVAVASLIASVGAIAYLKSRGAGDGGDAPRGGPVSSRPKIPRGDTIDRENIAPEYWGKKLPDLATWRDSGGPEFPPSGAHMEKFARYSLHEDMGIELPSSATDFHFGGSFRIPLEDFQPFFNEFLDALKINKETLACEGPESKHSHFGYPGEPKFRFVTVFRNPAVGIMRYEQLEFSPKTVGFSFIHTPNMMNYTFLLDPETGHCRFFKSRFED